MCILKSETLMESIREEASTGVDRSRAHIRVAHRHRATFPGEYAKPLNSQFETVALRTMKIITQAFKEYAIRKASWVFVMIPECTMPIPSDDSSSLYGDAGVEG